MDAFVSDTVFYRGQLIELDLVCYSGGSTSSPVQNLSNINVSVYLGVPNTNNLYAASVQDASNGAACATFLLPTNWANPYIWIQLADTNFNSFFYPRKLLKTVEAP